MEIIEIKGIQYNKEVIGDKGECLVPIPIRKWKVGDILYNYTWGKGIVSQTIVGKGSYNCFHIILLEGSCAGSSYNGVGCESVSALQNSYSSLWKYRIEG